MSQNLTLAEDKSGLTRRSLLQSAAIIAAVSSPGFKPALASANAETAALPQRLRGVNLGAWLVLEKWITPTLFKGVKAEDEYNFCAELGPKEARARLQAHRDSWITEADFAWLAKTGLNAVRIPVGYWVLDAPAPFVDGRETLDRAFLWAKRHNLKIVLDLHGVPGSQNGWDHSGRAGAMSWQTKPEYVAQTLDVIESFAKRYKGEPALAAIELMNEPRWDMPLDTLKTYYQNGYERVRRHISPDKAAVMIHDSFRPMEWSNFMTEPKFSNVILDTHLYQCYTPEDKSHTAQQHIEQASVQWSGHIDEMQKQLWTNVGEWSLALNPEVTASLTPIARDATTRAYAGSELLSFEKAQRGWFFWTYKTEKYAEWSFRESVRNGWLPSHFG